MPGRDAAASTCAKTPEARPGRNVAIDVLRGACIVQMIVAHVNTETFIFKGIHFLRFVSGAEGFVFLAGLVMGFVYRGRIERHSPMHAYKLIWRRVAVIWAAHCTLVMLAAAGNGRLYDHGSIPYLTIATFPRILALTLSLRCQPGHWLNILPLYVMLLAVAPLAFELLRRRLTWLVLGASMGALMFLQYVPDIGSIAHPRWGRDAFPPLAWQSLYFPGLCIGYHKAAIRDRLIAPHRSVLLYGLAAACALMVAAAWIETPGFAFYDHARWDGFLWGKHPLRLGRVLYFFLAVAALYLVTQEILRRAAPLRPSLDVLALLGRNSLYSFIVHLVIAVPLADVAVLPRRGPVMEAITVLVLATVYMLARFRVGRPYIPN